MKSSKRRFILSILTLIVFSVVMIILHNLFSAIWSEFSIPSIITFFLGIISLAILGIAMILGIVLFVYAGICKLSKRQEVS